MCRRCPNQQVYYKADDPHPYCKVECEAKTMCGEVQVPEDHLDVSGSLVGWRFIDIPTFFLNDFGLLCYILVGLSCVQ